MWGHTVGVGLNVAMLDGIPFVCNNGSSSSNFCKGENNGVEGEVRESTCHAAESACSDDPFSR